VSTGDAPLRRLIEDGKVHVMDGAMGTELYASGVFVNVSYDGLNLESPDVVEAVHRSYVNAGAEVIETNTFGANPVKLSSYGLADRTEEINREAVELARRSAQGGALVVGALGPLGIRIEPLGPTSREEAQAFYNRQVDGLVQGGVDGFVLETFSDLNEMAQAFRAIRARSTLPIICQVTVGEDCCTSCGTSPEDVAVEIAEWGADVIGLNCSVGPAVMLEAVERMAAVTDLPLSAQPNAGLPRAVGDRKIYLASPEYMAKYARRMIEAGARFLGGCCGTSPEHIRRIRALVSGVQPPSTRVRPGSHAEPHDTPVQPDVPLAERSEWGRKIAEGTFVTSVQITPPEGWDVELLLEQCRRIQAAGADTVNVRDHPRVHARMSALPAAMLIEREVGIETIVHYPCRDRTMTRMISDLLGAAAAGLHNLLLVTGRPPSTGPHPDSTASLDIDSIGLTNVVHGLNRGVDPGGNTIGVPTRFVMGTRVSQVAMDQEHEAGRLKWKVDAGTDFVITQPVFDSGRLHAFLDRPPKVAVPIVAGLRPLASLREAEFLHNEVPGIHIPDEIMERMAKAENDGEEAARAEGVRIALEVFAAIRDRIAGVHVHAPDGNIDGALEILAGVRDSI
jgi:methionine synthase I (cobalamin-dependent)/5,10-methylenetetrahydrofolate reductase